MFPINLAETNLTNLNMYKNIKSLKQFQKIIFEFNFNYVQYSVCKVPTYI